MINTCLKCEAEWAGQRAEHCPICHATFSGTASGDIHRIGDHGTTTGPNRRRCRTAEEMAGLRDKHGNPRLVATSNKFGTRVWHKWSAEPHPMASARDSEGRTGLGPSPSTPVPATSAELQPSEPAGGTN